MQASSSSSTSGANSSAGMYNIPNNLFDFSLASTSPLNQSFADASTTSEIPLSYNFVYSSPSFAPFMEDFVDLDVYTAHLSNDGETVEENALPLLRSNLPTFIKQVLLFHCFAVHLTIVSNLN